MGSQPESCVQALGGDPHVLLRRFLGQEQFAALIREFAEYFMNGTWRIVSSR